MKQILSKAGGVTTYIETTPLTNPQHQGWTRIRIYTTADFSRHPDYEQTKLDLCLDPEEFNTFKTAISSV